MVLQAFNFLDMWH